MESETGLFLYVLRFERNFSKFTIKNYSKDLASFFYFLNSEKGELKSLKNIDSFILSSYLGLPLKKDLSKKSVQRNLLTLRFS